MEKYKIFDGMIEGVQVIDQDWRYIYANEAVARHAKLSQSDLLGHTMMEKFPGVEKTPMFKLLKQCMQKRQAQEWVNEFGFPDGTKGYFELKIRPVDDGLLVLSFDITAQKRAHEIVRKSNEELEELVELRTKEILDQKILIEAQTEYLQDLNKAKDKFFNIIAHDLRSPLHSLKGLASIMVEGIGNLSAEDIKKLSQSLKSTVDNALNLTDNLIEWARIQIQEFETRKEEVDLEEILNDVRHLYQSQAEKKGIQLESSFDDCISVLGDKNQINFIIRNLVNNAIKFTKTGGRVRVIGSQDGEKHIGIRVEDDGIGMEKQILRKIRSEHFVESREGTSGEKGTAMGLKLCFEFAKLNDVKIQIDSEPNKGSVFSLTLKAFQSQKKKKARKRQVAT